MGDPEPSTYLPPAHRLTLIGNAWETVDERITTEADGPETVNERLSDGGVGPDGQPVTVRERLNGPGGTDGFDPDGHTVAEVNAYLSGVDDGERQRVLAAEASGQSRKGIVGE